MKNRLVSILARARLGRFPTILNPSVLFDFVSQGIGIDLGTANTLVYVKGKGIIIREPSYVARKKKSKEILAIGGSAKRMMGKTPPTMETIRPLRDGVIADFDATVAMLEYYIHKVHELTPSAFPRVPRPRLVVGIPSGVTEVERRAVADAAINAGARSADLIEEPMAAAIGAGLSVEDPSGIFIVDIGGGTTEIAVISLGGVVVGKSIRVAGDEMNEAIINFVRLKYSVLIGEATAEEVKIAIGSTTPEKDKYFVVRGRDLEKGLPKTLKLSSSEIREALTPILQEITSAVKEVVEEVPPELSNDIGERGITMAGGGSLLTGISKYISDVVNLPVAVTEDPLTAVVRGCGKMVEDQAFLKRIRVGR